MENWVKAGLAVLVVSALALVVSLLNPTPEPVAAPATSTVPPAPVTTVDPRIESSDWPCEHFRNVAGDVNAGILTDAELREKLKEARERASIAVPEIQTAATELLAAATAGDVAALRAGFSAMDAACEATGN